MIWLVAFLAVQSAICETVTNNVKVPLGEEIHFQTPKYPETELVDTEIIWELSTEEGSHVEVVCEDVRISPTDNCDEGYFKIGVKGNDGEGDGKYCGSEFGLTAMSAKNEMTLEFKLINASGVVKCSAKGVDERQTDEHPFEVTEDLDSDTESRYMKIGDEGYDNIRFNPLPRNMIKKWRFTTEPKGRFSFFCRNFKISNGVRCKDEELTITSGSKKQKFCGSDYNMEYISENNVMEIYLKTSNERGEMSCLVQAISGNNRHQYRNVISTEMDSSEFGTTRGQKTTSCNCGWANKQTKRVVNGRVARNGEFPWMVALRSLPWEIHFCGGSIITAKHVLTAAHCTAGKRPSEMQVLVGSNSRTNVNAGQTIDILKFHDHQYDKYTAHANDISVLELKTNIVFSQSVGPVCLISKQPVINHKYVTLMGWGYLGKEANMEHPEMLRATHMRVVDFPTCNFVYHERFDRAKPSRFCTWASNRDSCNGDSGGPLVWLDPETNRYTQMGLVSFGRGCNTDDPKINTAVSTYYEWIQGIVKKIGLDVCYKRD